MFVFCSKSCLLSWQALLCEKIQLILFHIIAVLIDILITIGFTVTFSRSRSEFKQCVDYKASQTSTDYPCGGRTRSILQRLLMYTASRGILVTFVQIGHIVMYFLDPSNFMFWSVIIFSAFTELSSWFTTPRLSIHFTLSKLYVISTRTSPQTYGSPLLCLDLASQLPRWAIIFSQ